MTEAGPEAVPASCVEQVTQGVYVISTKCRLPDGVPVAEGVLDADGVELDVCDGVLEEDGVMDWE